jgi:hypothetical protein
VEELGACPKPGSFNPLPRTAMSGWEAMPRLPPPAASRTAESLNLGFRLKRMKTASGTTLLALAACLGIALVGCSGAAGASPAEPAARPASQQQIVSQDAAEKTPTEPGHPCDATPGNRIVFPVQAEGRVFAEVKHELIDLGSRDYAAGDVTLDTDGKILSYTVAPGDSPIAIGDRFCVDYITVLQYNQTWPEIDPGEVLVLRPDPSVQWGDTNGPEGGAA